MGDPFSSEPAPRQHGKLLDRAHLLGDAGRSGRERADVDPEEFEALLEGRVKGRQEAADRSKPEEDPELGLLPEEEGAAAAAAGAATLDADRLEARTEERGREETEKRLGAWRGPSPFAGLPAAASLGLAAAGNVDRGERTRGEARTAPRTEIRPGEARVDPELLQGLAEAGLASPLGGLDDPRLAGTTPMLSAEEGWRDAPTAHGVGYLWEAPGKVAWQRLDWSEGHVLLESASRDRLQVLERQGNQLFVRHARREAPPAFPV